MITNAVLKTCIHADFKIMVRLFNKKKRTLRSKEMKYTQSQLSRNHHVCLSYKVKKGMCSLFGHGYLLS